MSVPVTGIHIKNMAGQMADYAVLKVGETVSFTAEATTANAAEADIAWDHPARSDALRMTYRNGTAMVTALKVGAETLKARSASDPAFEAELRIDVVGAYVQDGPNALTEVSQRKPSEYRLPPTEDFAVDVVVNVHAPADGGDATELIQNAIHQAVDNWDQHRRKTRLVFDAGATYYIDPASNPASNPPGADGLKVGKGKQAFQLSGGGYIILEGNGATIMNRNPSVGFFNIANTTHVTVRNFKLDYANKPFTQGTVQQVVTLADGTRQLRVRIDPGYADLEQPGYPDNHSVSYFKKVPGTDNSYTNYWVVVYDSEDPTKYKVGLEEKMVVDPVRLWHRNSDGTYDIVFKPTGTPSNPPPLERVEAGDKFAIGSRLNGSAIGVISNSNHVNMIGNRIYTGPAAAFTESNSSMNGYLRNTIKPHDGDLVAELADGIFVYADKVGPWIEGNTIANNWDDQTVIKTFASKASEKIDNRNFKLSGNGVNLPIEIGDLLNVFDPGQGSVVDEGIVTAISPYPVKNFNTTPVVVTFDRDMLHLDPAASPAQRMVNDSRISANFVIKDNDYKSGRRWANLIRSHDGIITGNTFEASNDSAIMLTNDETGAAEFDGGIPRSLNITGNTFVDSIRSYNDRQNQADFDGVITGEVTRYSGRLWVPEPSPNDKMQNIVIANNSFDGWWSSSALKLNTVAGLFVKNNRFDFKGYKYYRSELIRNGDFHDGLTGWEVTALQGRKVDYESSETGFQATVHKPDTAHSESVKLSQNMDRAIYPNLEYTLKFKAGKAGAGNQMRVGFAGIRGNLFKLVMNGTEALSHEISLTDEEKEYSLKVMLPSSSLASGEYEKNKAKLLFLIGGLDGVYIDDITLMADTADHPPSAISLNLTDQATLSGNTFNDLPIRLEVKQSSSVANDDGVD